MHSLLLYSLKIVSCILVNHLFSPFQFTYMSIEHSSFLLLNSNVAGQSQSGCEHCAQLGLCHQHCLCKQTDLHPIWLSKHDSHSHPFCRYVPRIANLCLDGYLCSQEADCQQDSAHVSILLWVCGLHKLVSSEQHCRNLPTGKGYDDTSDSLSPSCVL